MKTGWGWSYEGMCGAMVPALAQPTLCTSIRTNWHACRESGQQHVIRAWISRDSETEVRMDCPSPWFRDKNEKYLIFVVVWGSDISTENYRKANTPRKTNGSRPVVFSLNLNRSKRRNSLGPSLGHMVILTSLNGKQSNQNKKDCSRLLLLATWFFDFAIALTYRSPTWDIHEHQVQWPVSTISIVFANFSPDEHILGWHGSRVQLKFRLPRKVQSNFKFLELYRIGCFPGHLHMLTERCLRCGFYCPVCACSCQATLIFVAVYLIVDGFHLFSVADLLPFNSLILYS